MPDFEAMYAADADPWQVETAWYERRKLSVLLASLPRERYRPRLGAGLRARHRSSAPRRPHRRPGRQRRAPTRRCGWPATATRDLPHVRVRRAPTLPEVPLEGPVDLLVVAEFLYYVPDLAAALDVLWSACAPGAHLAFVHWAHRPHDALPQRPRDARAASASTPAARRRQLVEHADEDFLLDVYEVPA